MRRLPLTLVVALVLSSPGYAEHGHKRADRAWQEAHSPLDYNWTARQESYPTTIWMGRNRITLQPQGECGPDPLNCNNSANGS